MNQRGRYILRVALGGYLAFVGGNLTWEMWTEKPSDMAFKMFMGIIFLVVGVAYAIWSIKTVVGEMKSDFEEQQKVEAEQEAARKLEEKHKRDQMKFRTAPMPAPSEIVKGMVTIKEEKKEETPESSAANVSVDITEKETPTERLNKTENTDNTEVEETEFEEA